MNIQHSIELFCKSDDSDIQANRKLHYRTKFQGFDVSIENRAGSIRRGTATDGTQWATKFKVPYGYIRKTVGTDGDHVDVFIGPNQSSDQAHVISINDPKTGQYDEDKVFLGFNSADEAKQCFDDHYDRPKTFFRGISSMPIEAFRNHVLDKTNHGEAIREEDQPNVSESPERVGSEGIRAYTDIPIAMYPLDAPHPPSLKKGRSIVDESIKRRKNMKPYTELR